MAFKTKKEKDETLIAELDEVLSAVTDVMGRLSKVGLIASFTFVKKAENEYGVRYDVTRNIASKAE